MDEKEKDFENAFVEHYKGNPIKFYTDSEFGLMVNATDIARIFGTTPRHWRTLKETKEYLKANDCENKIIAKSGADACTWMYYPIAQHFADWVSPLFSMWLKETLDEHLVSYENKPEDTATTELQKKVAELEKQLKDKEEEIYNLNKERKDLLADSTFAKVILSHGKEMSIGEFADMITIEDKRLDAETFIQWLGDHQYYNVDNFGVKTEYIERGLFVLDTKAFCDKEGTYHKLQKTLPHA